MDDSINFSLSLSLSLFPPLPPPSVSCRNVNTSVNRYDNRLRIDTFPRMPGMLCDVLEKRDVLTVREERSRRGQIENRFR